MDRSLVTYKGRDSVNSTVSPFGLNPYQFSIFPLTKGTDINSRMRFWRVSNPIIVTIIEITREDHLICKVLNMYVFQCCVCVDVNFKSSTTFIRYVPYPEFREMYFFSVSSAVP